MDLKEQYDKLLRYCYGITQDRFIAEDIVQETFLRFWGSKTYQETGKEMAYLYTIARNLCMDEFRKPQWIDIEQCEDEIANDFQIEQNLLSLELNEALSRLPEEQRELVILRYANELSVTDISKITGLSRFSVYRRLKEGLSALRRNLEGGDEG